MKAFVTGSTGMLGNNLIHELTHAGYEVKALVRSIEKAQNVLGHLNVEFVEGDMLDVDAFAPQLSDCDVLFHCAAYYRDYYTMGEHWQMLEDVNIKGTINLLTAAEAQGVKKTIYVSSGGVIGRTKDGSTADESTPPDDDILRNLYLKSKVIAEEKVAEWLKTHQMPVVLMLPTAIWGPWDAAPTSSGRLIIDFLNGELPIIPPGGFRVIDARDCALAMITAVEKGKSGERYIISNKSYQIKEILRIISKLTGRPMPAIALPYPVALIYAYISEFIAKITGSQPLATVNAVRVLGLLREVSSAKAIRELDLTLRPFEETLRDEVQWYLDHGYIKNEQVIRQQMVLEA